MSTRLVIGAGAVGGLLAQRLVERGDDVRLATRSGTALRGTTPVRLDVKDADAVTRAAGGAHTVFLCTNPPYPAWAAEWPPAFESVIAAGERTGADVVVMGNVYAYGAVDDPMREGDPLAATEPKGRIRADGWRRLKAAHDGGRLRVAEVRASDYFGPDAGKSAHLGSRFFEPLLAGRTARVVGDPTLEHSWAYLPDIVRTLVAAADHAGEWGRAWHPPHSSSLPRTTIAAQVKERFGGNDSVRPYPRPLMATLARFAPDIREVMRMEYQFTRPFLVDSTETERLLGVRATPWDEALAATGASYR
ncbi:NAD-dependent epimerase/dehydratase family protein [Lysobacter korlensis]|uniref:NAD-dependent epimerase/dehydratase family protein n=1 Tax=Lysobacter korlensis TaxID=553636 RepID=A0ABV6RYY4_9GAMM